jgi:hypothetical protein
MADRRHLHGHRRPAGCRDEYIDLTAGVPQIADDIAVSHYKQVYDRIGEMHAEIPAERRAFERGEYDRLLRSQTA